MINPHALSARIHQQRHIYLDPAKVDTTAEELTPEHEGRLIAEYGFEALVRYYCPGESGPKEAA